jgi:hypothetical protein
MWWVFGVVAAGLMVALSAQDSQARPKYFAEFKTAYPKLEEQANEKKCNVCHIGATDKKTRNDYGKALHKGLGGDDVKNVMDAEKIKEAIKKAEKEKSSTDGKTFGDLISSGKLPGKNPE